MRCAAAILSLFLAFPLMANTKAPKISDWVDEAWMKTQMSLQEEAFRVDKTETGFVVIWVHGGSRFHVDVPVGPKTVALFHTHNEDAGPEPSKEDVHSAVVARIPVYVVSARSIWRANPDGTTEKVRDR